MDLSSLKAHVDRARAEFEAPVPPGGSKPIAPISYLLADEGWTELWSVVRGLQADHGEIFNLFPEGTAALNVIDILSAADKAPTLEELAAELRTLAAREGPWLVSTPLVGIEMLVDQPVVKIDDQTILWRADLGAETWKGVDQGAREADEASALEVFNVLGDHLNRPTRFLTFGVKDDIDTGRAATIVSVEVGSIGLALSRAQSRAAYAIAVWIILEPPADDRVTPDLGVWVPQPHIHVRQRYKRQEHGVWPAKESTRGGAIALRRGYDVPSPDVLRLPFEAFARRDRRCAQALLSASLALHTASRGSRYRLSEQLRSVRSAIEMLCEPPRGGAHPESRWQQLVARYDIETKLAARGYEQGDAKEISHRLRQARNIATHGADAALLDLGWSAGVDRKLRGSAVAKAEDLGLPALHADLSMLLFAVRLVLREMWPVIGDDLPPAHLARAGTNEDGPRAQYGLLEQGLKRPIVKA